MSRRNIIVRMTVCKVVDHDWALSPSRRRHGTFPSLPALCSKESHGDGGHLVTAI
jgi:hypothetical protein